MLEVNKVYCMDNMEGMKLLEDCTIDLTVTSPPYDKMRKYNGFTWNFEEVANQLLRITKLGGVLVWIVSDSTINGSETGTSFKQALYFKEIGFNLHDTMIYQKSGVGACGSNYSYWQSFEYMFVLSKGRPVTVNRIRDKVNSMAGQIRWSGEKEIKTRTNRVGEKTEKLGYRENIWKYHASPYFSGDDVTKHPAPFPEKLAEDHILSWSNENELILDPFMGSGTTAKMAKLNNRNYIGFEISQEYCDIAEKRLNS
jgi:DNA modification methylase